VSGLLSAHRVIKVAPLVTLVGPAPAGAQLKTGFANRATFTGVVSPSDVGAEVWLEREDASSFEEWKPIQRTFVKASGAYVFVHQFGAPGNVELRTIVRAHGHFDVRGISNSIPYVISQPQNPNLTINSSEDPTTFGKPITISGVLAGASAGTKVTLWSRGRGATVFTKAGEVPVESGGAYKFPIASATANALYRVTGGTQASAVLAEGVKYIVNATPPPSTAQAGTPVTFSGTIAPGPTGAPFKVVYLERENAFGGGFHVADVVAVPSGSTAFSIVHFVFGTGKQVYRVHVPGDPLNEGASSPTFTIEVTPAPPGLFTPVPQSKLPR
jgi:hypothetical protein